MDERIPSGDHSAADRGGRLVGGLAACHPTASASKPRRAVRCALRRESPTEPALLHHRNRRSLVCLLSTGGVLMIEHTELAEELLDLKCKA